MVDRIQLRTYTQRLWPLLVVLWFAALISAARPLLRYEWTAGAMHAAPSRLGDSGTPGAASLSFDRSRGEGLLIVAVHPLCSCTRATLEELENSAVNWKQPYRAAILLYTPKGQGSATPAFKPAAYINDAKRALHADLVLDENGEQAARLGAFTSGEVLYYSAADNVGRRRLLFSGGVTAGRGMVGENGSIDALEHAVLSTSPQSHESEEAHPPVYGCGLGTLANASLVGQDQIASRSPAR